MVLTPPNLFTSLGSGGIFRVVSGLAKGLLRDRIEVVLESVDTAAAKLVVEEAGAARLVGAGTLVGVERFVGAEIGFVGWEAVLGANGLNPFVCNEKNSFSSKNSKILI